MDIITHAKFHCNRLMSTLIFGIWASERALQVQNDNCLFRVSAEESPNDM